jgi:HPt (histidine-containing phosphotransfer) domain-containing protein
VSSEGPNETQAPEPVMPGRSAAATPVFDAELARKRCCNNPEMVEKMIDFFIDDVDKLFPKMREALEKGDLAEVGHLGHRMKGTIVYLGAESAREAATAVERFAIRDGDRAEAAAAVEQLERACRVLKAALVAHQAAATAAMPE